VAMSQTKAAWPSEARMAEAGGRLSFKIASFQDRLRSLFSLATNADGVCAEIRRRLAESWASCAPILCRVHKYSGNHVSFSSGTKQAGSA
jgi:hypothetical protein